MENLIFSMAGMDTAEATAEKPGKKHGWNQKKYRKGLSKIEPHPCAEKRSHEKLPLGTDVPELRPKGQGQPRHR